MGNFTEGTPPAPAPEYPPENAIDIASFVAQAFAEGKKAGVITSAGGVKLEGTPGWIYKELLALLGGTSDILSFLIGVASNMSTPLLTKLVEISTALTSPLMQLGGGLASIYVGQLVAGLTGVAAGAKQGDVKGLTPPAQQMFDGIMAPLSGLTQARNPAEAGAGQTNSQYALGSIIQLHLSTWIINIISNLTGLGVLKYINSFDEAVTGSLNARALGRVALKPYLEKFMATPLTRDLNVALPLAIGSTSQLVKRYIRGNMTNQELKAGLRGLGFDDAVVEDMLLDTAKLLSVSAVWYLVKNGGWTEGDAVHHLTQMGYPAALAPAVLEIEKNALVDSQMDAMASALVSAYIDRDIDDVHLTRMLDAAGFTEEEQRAYKLHGDALREIPKKLSYTQVRGLYQDGLVDLDYVMQFLTDEGYGPDAVDLLVLWEFTKKDDRDKRALDLANRKRVAQEAALARAQAADAARQAALAKLAG